MTIKMEAATGVKQLAEGRSDLFKLKPSDLYVKEGWNSREAEDPDNIAHIDELARSIAQVGVKTPLTVYWDKDRIVVIDGHMRLAAVRRAIDVYKAEIKTIPVQTESQYASEADRVFGQIVRNAGKPLAPLEQARVFKRLIDLGWDEVQIAAKSGRSRQSVVELLTLQAAPAAVTDLVKQGRVSATFAKSAIKESGGDTEKAAGMLNLAVARASEQGKERATAKHAVTVVPDARDAVRAALREAEMDGGDYVVRLTGEAYRAACAMVKIASPSTHA